MRKASLRACLGISFVCTLSVELIAAAPADKAPPVVRPEEGRELIGPDGRTLTDKEYGYAIQLPAPDWKVYRHIIPAMAGNEPILEILSPDLAEQVNLRVRFAPGPIKKLKEFMEDGAKKNGERPFDRSVLGERNGVRYWEFEVTDTSVKSPYHMYGRMYERDATHKVGAGVRAPLDRWQADQKLLRETVDNVRINP